MRGQPFPIATSEAAREWFTGCWPSGTWNTFTIDTWGALCQKNGIRNQNDDGEVRQLLDALDQIKRDARVASLLVLIHTPHQVPGQRHLERFKGAGAVGDWADVLWNYVADQDGTRYLSAVGRARIDLPEQSVYFDGRTGALSWGMTGSRVQTTAVRDGERVMEALCNAEGGMLTEDLLDAAGGHRNDVRRLIKNMTTDGRLESRPSKKDGPRARRYFLPGSADQSSEAGE